jgi:hypothetical membrane protein
MTFITLSTWASKSRESFILSPSPTLSFSFILPCLGILLGIFHLHHGSYLTAASLIFLYAVYYILLQSHILTYRPSPSSLTVTEKSAAVLFFTTVLVLIEHYAALFIPAPSVSAPSLLESEVMEATLICPLLLGMGVFIFALGLISTVLLIPTRKTISF